MDASSFYQVSRICLTKTDKHNDNDYRKYLIVKWMSLGKYPMAYLNYRCTTYFSTVGSFFKLLVRSSSTSSFSSVNVLQDSK